MCATQSSVHTAAICLFFSLPPACLIPCYSFFLSPSLRYAVTYSSNYNFPWHQRFLFKLFPILSFTKYCLLSLSIMCVTQSSVQAATIFLSSSQPLLVLFPVTLSFSPPHNGTKSHIVVIIIFYTINDFKKKLFPILSPTTIQTLFINLTMTDGERLFEWTNTFLFFFFFMPFFFFLLWELSCFSCSFHLFMPFSFFSSLGVELFLFFFAFLHGSLQFFLLVFGVGLISFFFFLGGAAFVLLIFDFFFLDSYFLGALCFLSLLPSPEQAAPKLILRCS